MKEETNWEIYRRQGSAIISPSGEYLAGPMPWKEGILYADIDLERVISPRKDVVGHYSRSDIFKLFVNEEQLVPMAMLNAKNEFSTQVDGEGKSTLKELIGKIERLTTEVEKLKRMAPSR
jgi:hypothetical protein